MLGRNETRLNFHIHPSSLLGKKNRCSDKWKSGKLAGATSNGVLVKQVFFQTNHLRIHLVISVRGGRAAAPPVGKNSIIRAKLMYRSGKDTVKNILLFNILIYLFSSRISLKIQNGTRLT